MRILYLITLAERGGAQVHVADLLRGFAPHHEVALAAGEDGYLCDVARFLRIPVFVLPQLVHPMSPWKDAVAVKQFLRLQKAWKPDLVHAHTSKAGMVARVAGFVSRTPTVFTAHTWSFSTFFPRPQQAIALQLERLAGSMNCRIIAVSEATREFAVRCRAASPRKLFTVWNGVGDTPHRASPGSAVCPRIIMVARLVGVKEHDLLIRALRGVHGDFYLDLVGDGPLRPQLEAQGRSLGGRVIFHGERTDVAELLAQAHISVLASKWEGLPLTILESMRAGLPVIASDVGGVAEAVTEGVNGYLVPMGDEVKLRQRLQALISKPALRAAMGTRGRARYERDFTLHEMLSRTATVYRNAMGDGPFDVTTPVRSNA
jgi:glycosyltransferase involved in cell wall biosynthesis